LASTGAHNRFTLPSAAAAAASLCWLLGGAGSLVAGAPEALAANPGGTASGGGGRTAPSVPVAGRARGVALVPVAHVTSVRYTSSYGPIYVFRHALHPPTRPHPAPGGPVSGTAFDGQGMWIWYLSQSNGGEVASIAARAHQSGVSTVFVKSSDGSSNYWSQFS